MATPRPLVLNLGLPKTGTTSIAAYFACNGWRSSHWNCGNASKCAVCMMSWLVAVAQREHSGSRGWRERLDMSGELQRHCGDFDVFAEIDLQMHSACIYPQVEHLHTLVRVLPKACFILTVRPMEHWLRSVRAWGLKPLSNRSSHVATYEPERDTLLSKMLSSCPILPRTEAGLLAWHSQHLERVSGSADSF